MELVKLKGNVFEDTIGFSLESRGGFFFGEWGEKCDRALKQVVIRLVDGEGREIDKVILNVRGDFLITADGFVLRSPANLHGNQS